MPPSRGAAPPPIATRSFISVALATFQPSPTSPSRCASGIRTSVEEHLVELGLAGDLAQRPDLDAGVVHVADEVGDARRAWARRGRCGRPGSPSRAWCALGGPHLLAVDDPVVAVADRAGGQRRQVGAGARLAEQLAPDLLAGPQRPQEAPALLVGAEREDRRRGHARGRCRCGAGRCPGRRPGQQLASTYRLQRAAAAPSPPSPSGKCTQASPASNRARRNSSRSVVAGSCAASSAATRDAQVRRGSPRRSRPLPSLPVC